VIFLFNMAEGRRQRTVVAVTDGTLMSVAAWCKTLQPTAEEAAITLDQVLSRTSWDAPEDPAEVPAFIGSAGAAGSEWVRTDRPEAETETAPSKAPTRPAKVAATATTTRSYMGSDRVWTHMDADRQAVLDASKQQLQQANVDLPESLIASLVIVKKNASAVSTTAQSYKRWANLLDFETLAWDRIERELKRGLFYLPHAPFVAGPNESVTLYVNSHAFEPRSGSRQIVGTLWLLVHYLIAKSENGLTNGVSVVTQGAGISYSKFYPAIQKCLMDSLQAVLPLRVASIHIVDPPYIFQMLWGIVSGWLSEKMRNRVYVVAGSNVTKHFDKATVPTWLKGDKAVDPTQGWDDVKAFYHNEFLPAMSVVADAPGEVKKPELWESAGKK